MITDREIYIAAEAVTREIVMQRREEYAEWDAKAIARAALEAAEEARFDAPVATSKHVDTQNNDKTRENIADYLENYNAWRRGADSEQPNPKELGVYLELAIKELRK